MNIIEIQLPDRARFAMNDNIIHSDTLFSAMVNCYIKLYGNENVEKFIETIRVSSVFMGLDLGEERLYFLPKPAIEPLYLESSDRDKVKKWKKIKFLSKEIFEKLLAGELTNDYEKWNDIALTRKEYDKLKVSSLFGDDFKKINYVNKYVEAKNTLNRYSGKSENLFFTEVVEFQSLGKITPFFYFFIEEVSSEIMTSLRLMADEGLGGKRSTGKGILKSVKKAELNLEINYEKYISLSLTFPKDIKEARSAENYDFVKRGGFVYYGGGTGWRKKRIRMYDIGSVFSEKVEGQNVESVININGDGEKKIYHYGKPFMIGGRDNG